MKIQSKKIDNQLTLVISISVVIIFVVLGFLFYKSSFKLLTDKLKVEIQTKADLVSKDIKNIFENSKLTTHYLTSNQDIKKY